MKAQQHVDSRVRIVYEKRDNENTHTQNMWARTDSACENVIHYRENRIRTSRENIHRSRDVLPFPPAVTYHHAASACFFLPPHYHVKIIDATITSYSITTTSSLTVHVHYGISQYADARY